MKPTARVHSRKGHLESSAVEFCFFPLTLTFLGEGGRHQDSVGVYVNFTIYFLAISVCDMSRFRTFMWLNLVQFTPP